MTQDFNLKDYKDLNDPLKEVIADLFSEKRFEQVSALQYIIHNPEAHFAKALARKNEGISDAYVIASYVKAVAMVLRTDALPFIANHLRHPEARVRANCVEALELSGVDPSKKQILSILMNFLSDPDARVAGNCIKALSRSLKPNELDTLIQDYFEPLDERKCLNTLYLIQNLRPNGALSILESCLNHKSEKIRSRSKAILATFESELPQARAIALRKTVKNSDPVESPDTTDLSSRETLEKLVQSLRNSNTREASHLLQDLGKRGKNSAVAEFLKKLLSNESLGLDPFLLATTVKTLACASTEKEEKILRNFLKHDDGRVVANTVEAMSMLQDPYLEEFLSQHLEKMDFTDPIQVRILSSGMNYLKQNQRELAFLAMKKLSEGDLNSRTTFLMHLQSWDHDLENFVPLVLAILESEIRIEILRNCLDFLEVHGSRKTAEIIFNLCEGLADGDKKQIIQLAYKKLARKFNLEESFTESFEDDEDKPQASSTNSNSKTNEAPKRKVFSNLEEKATAFLKASSAGKYWKIPVALEGEKVGTLKISKTMLQFSGFLGLTILLTICGIWLLPEDPQKSNLVKRRESLSAANPGSKASSSNIKGRGTIRSIDFEDGSVQTNGDRGEFSIRFDDLANLDQLKVGQRVKFVGQFVDKDSSEMVHVKGKFIFEDVKLGSKKAKNS